MKKLTSILLSFALLFNFFIFESSAASTASLEFYNVSVSNAGMLEVTGVLHGYSAGDQITFLVADKSYLTEKRELSGEDIIYIDQADVGNNGVFYWNVYVNQKFSEADAVVMCGSSAEVETIRTEVSIPQLPPDLSVVENNSVIFGRDCYYVPSAYYKDVDTIASSFSFGGNHIYFKVGDYWYNLLDSKATSNSFLIPDNSTPVNDVEKLVPRYYYAVNNKYTLRYYALSEEGR